MGEEVVNNALAIAQHITKYLEDDHAVSYLQAIEKLSIDDWKSCKVHLEAEGVNKANRTWKEGHIRDVVEVFRSVEVKTSFLLRDLSLCPGFDKLAVELASFHAATLHCISHVTGHSSRSRDTPLTNANISDNPALISNNQNGQHTPAPRGTLPPNSNWGGRVNNNIERGRKKQGNKTRDWYCGTNQSTNKSIKVPLTPICLAVKSGCDETVHTLKKELEPRNYQNLEAKLVTAADHYTLFRVKFKIATSLQEKWKEPSSWPVRMIAS